MSSPHPDAAHIAARQERLIAAYNTRDIERVLEVFVDEGLEYSDYSVMKLKMDKGQFRGFTISMFDTVRSFTVTTVSLTGSKDFTAWEWKMNFVKKAEESEFQEMNSTGSKEGEVLEMAGVSLTWWNEQDKAVKNHDYARIV